MVRVYVNGRGLDAPAGATCLEAVRLAEPEEATAIESGSRAIADSRGLPLPTETPVYAGAIYRTIRNKARSTGGA